MPLRDDLLNPIPGANPSGANLRYAPVYDKIKEARREDDDAPQGEWAHERKVADWKQVVKLAGESLATKSKDLQLAAWLTEAMLRTEGFAGLLAGLKLLQALLENFWDTLYPEIEDGEAEMRAAPLDWVGSPSGGGQTRAVTFDQAVRMAPITSRAFSRNDSPARVSRIPCGARSRSSNPHVRSRSRTARDTAGWLTPIARAAAVKPPYSATATNARNNAGFMFMESS